MKNKIQILVIDDEAQIRKLLKITLEANDYSVTLAANSNEGQKLAASIKPEIILLDLNLPDKDGLSTLKELRSWSKAQILILSVRNSENDKISLLDAGADDYICKPFHSGELLARIRVALRHKEHLVDSPLLVIGEFEVNFQSMQIRKNSVLLQLTSTEYAILKLLLQNTNRVLTHKQILENIWGNSFTDETQYLRVFIAQIRKKIDDEQNNSRYIKTISGVGYMFSYEE